MQNNKIFFNLIKSNYIENVFLEERHSLRVNNDDAKSKEIIVFVINFRILALHLFVEIKLKIEKKKKEAENVDVEVVIAKKI